MKRAFFVLVTILALVFGSNVSQASFTVPDDIDLQDQIVWQSIVDGTFSSVDGHSWVQASLQPDRATGRQGSNYPCKNFDDPSCQGKDVIYGHLLLSPCSAAVTTGCIESLSVGRSNDGLKPATLGFEAISQRIPASKLGGVPAGGSVSLWKADDARDFLVVASVTYQVFKGSAEANLTNFQVNLIPTSYQQNSNFFAPLSIATTEGGSPNVLFGNTDPNRISTVDTRNCLVITDGYCFERREFDGEVRAKVVLKVPNEVTGWLFGRMKQPAISVETLDNETNRLSVEATSTYVPNLLGTVRKSEVLSDKGILAWAQSFFTTGDGNLERRLAEKGAWGGSSSGTNKLEFVDWWGDRLKVYGGSDLRFATSTRWMFGSSSGLADGPCFADKTKLTGLVTTNAPFYESGPPKFKDGSLSYVVAGPHHLADGVSLFKGVYDLAIRSEVARCIYGFSEAPLKAEVSVVAASGDIQDVATESMTERDGWIRLGAYNFTFSKPTIKVKFSQDTKKNVVTPQPSKKSILCIKGKMKRTVLGSKCPKGFRKAN